MGEGEREKVERKVLGMRDDEMCSIDCWISAGGFGRKDEEGKEKRLDGWVLPMLEVQRVRRMREELYDVELETFYGFEDEGERVCVEDLDLRYALTSSIIAMVNCLIACASRTFMASYSLDSLQRLRVPQC
jgi:hypothetical protein